MNFYITFVKSRKKVDKYFKINRIRNKYVIDIRKIMEEEKIDLNDRESTAFFKVLVWNRILLAQQKNKDIYYMPNFHNHELEVVKLLALKNAVFQDDAPPETNRFNLLMFHDEFVGTKWLDDVMKNIEHFDSSQVLQDY